MLVIKKCASRELTGTAGSIRTTGAFDTAYTPIGTVGVLCVAILLKLMVGVRQAEGLFCFALFSFAHDSEERAAPAEWKR